MINLSNVQLPEAHLHKKDNRKARTPHLLAEELRDPKYLQLLIKFIISNKCLSSDMVMF